MYLSCLEMQSRYSLLLCEPMGGSPGRRGPECWVDSPREGA